MDRYIWGAISWSIIAICLAVVLYTAIIEHGKNVRCAFNNGLIRQFDSNISGWMKP